MKKRSFHAGKKTVKTKHNKNWRNNEASTKRCTKDKKDISTIKR